MSKKEHKEIETEENLNPQAEPAEKADDVQQNEVCGEAEADAKEEDKLQEMGEKLASLNDKYLRLYSEYENYRKRTNA